MHYGYTLHQGLPRSRRPGLTEQVLARFRLLAATLTTALTLTGCDCNGIALLGTFDDVASIKALSGQFIVTSTTL